MQKTLVLCTTFQPIAPFPAFVTTLAARTTILIYAVNFLGSDDGW